MMFCKLVDKVFSALSSVDIIYIEVKVLSPIFNTMFTLYSKTSKFGPHVYVYVLAP